MGSLPPPPRDPETERYLRRGLAVVPEPAAPEKPAGALSRAFYGPPDWIIANTTVRQRRAINFWLLVVWLVPGLLLWYLLRNVLWFIGFMSIYAIWTGHLGALSGETPVEHEQG